MSRQLFFAMSETGKRQVDRDTPLALAAIDQRINITSRNYVETAKTIEEIFDCIGEDVVDREVTRIIRRVTIEAPYNPEIFAPMLAYCKGVAGAPTGASADKIITIAITGATGGTFLLTLPAYDGYGAQPAMPIPFNPTPGQLKYILENLDNVLPGNTIVGFAGGVFTVEFTGKRGFANIPTLTRDITNLVGAGADVAIAETQAGSQRAHVITEIAGYQPPYTGFVMGFEDETGSARELVGAQVAACRVNAPEGGGAMTMSFDIIARDLVSVPTYVPPVCTTYRPMRLADCRLQHGGTDYGQALTDYAYAFSNNTLTGNSAYTGRGVKPSRLERAKRRTRTLTFGLLGGVTDALRLEAEGNPEGAVRRATVLRMGTDGRNVTETFPNNLLTVDGAGLAFQAETEDSINRFTSNPDRVGATAPSSSVANVAQATAFLLT